jgi:hypothetical protein
VGAGTGRQWAALRVAIAVLVTMASLGVASAAYASSIFFLRDSNIWVANPDGSGAKQVTTDGSSAAPYDFVASAKQGSAPPIAFHRSGPNAGYGTMNPDGSGEHLNPYNSQMTSGRAFIRLNAAGDRLSYSVACACAGNAFAGSVGTDGSSAELIYHANVYGDYGAVMEAINVAFGDPAGDSLLFTDVGESYNFNTTSVCNGTDAFSYVLVLQTPPPSGQSTGPGPSEVYCVNGTSLLAPEVSPNGKLIVAQAQLNVAGASGEIVTIPITGGVVNASEQSPITALTRANSGTTNPDFSPDGSEVALQGPNNTIYTVPTSGGTATGILNNASVPAWSPYTLGGGSKLKLTVTLSSKQNVLKQKGLVLHAKCDTGCAIGAVGHVSIKGTRKPFNTKQGVGVGKANRSVSLSLSLSHKALSAIKNALAHHKRVTAKIVADAQHGHTLVPIIKTFRVTR